MYLRNTVRESFALIQSDWSVEKATKVIENLSPTHVIVHRKEPGEDFYYLYDRVQVLKFLSASDSQKTIHEAFGLHEYTATPQLDAYSDEKTSPDRGVVIEDGRVIGFLDRVRKLALAKPRRKERGKKGGGSRGGGFGRGGGRVIARRGIEEPVEHEGDEVAPLKPSAKPRSMVADFPVKVPLNETVSLLVKITAASFSPVTGESSIILGELTEGSDIDIVVQPKRGFLLQGRGEGKITVSDKNDVVLQFKMKAIELGQGKIIILAFSQGSSIGTITIAPTVTAATEHSDGQRVVSEQPVVQIEGYQPDLSLLILELEHNGLPSFELFLSAKDPSLGLCYNRYGPVPLKMKPSEYFKDFFGDIENLPLTTSKDRAIAEERLTHKGEQLFSELIPADMQGMLWKLRNRIDTLHIISEEPWIPWEVCKLQGRRGESVVEGKFFCEYFSVTRWIPEIGLKPNLKMKKIALVVPDDSNLAFAKIESDYIMSLENNYRKVIPIPANYLEVTKALASGEYDGWHFSGHGGFQDPDPNRSVICLEDNELLTPEDINGTVKNLGRAQPLIFLNACQIGRSAMSLTKIGGWAAQFLRANAAAFIGSYWSIDDKAASEFTQALYSRLLGGMPIGQAAKEARKEIKQKGNSTWLAYTVFAHPLARVQT